MSKTVVLKNKLDQRENAIRLLDANLQSVQQLFDALPESITVDIPLLQRLNDGLTMDEVYNELATDYIRQMTPAPLVSMIQAIRKDFYDRSPGDGDTLRTFRGMYSFFENQTGEQPDIVKTGKGFVISDQQKKRLFEGCSHKLTDQQSEYIKLLEAYKQAKTARQAFEQKCNLHSHVGDKYLGDGDIGILVANL